MKATDTRTSLLESSYTLMLAHGYAATGVDEICRHAQVSKGSFYHFFKTKQQCAMEMLKHHMAGAQATLEEGLDLSGLNRLDGAIAYVKHLEGLSETVFRDGCLIGAFALELAESHPELRQEVSRELHAMASHFEEVLSPLTQCGPSQAAPSARELAEQMLTAIEGGVVLSKAHGNPRYVSQALRLFRHYLELLKTHSVRSAN